MGKTPAGSDGDRLRIASRTVWPTLADALTDKIRPRLENVFASV